MAPSGKGFFYLVLAQLMVALTIVYSKGIVQTMPFVYLMEIRFLFATLMLLVIHSVVHPDWGDTFRQCRALSGKDWGYFIAQALAAGLLFNFFLLYGLNYTSANAAGIITCVLPALITLLSCLILREVLNAQKAISVAFATVGLLIFAVSKVAGTHVQHSLRGDLLILAAVFPESMYYILTRMNPIKLPVFFLAALTNGINIFASLLLFIFFPTKAFHITASQWFILFFLAVFSAFFYVFWLEGMKHIEAITASLSTAFVPVWTVMLSWGVLGEKLTRYQAVGMIFVIFSVMIASKRTGGVGHVPVDIHRT